jgi:glycosyltransferase involved in cell wall biosynthesis
MLVITNGVDLAALGAAAGNRGDVRAELGIPDDAFVVGSVGRYHPAKDHENLVGAAAVLLERRPEAVFLLIGRDVVPDNTELTSLIGATGATDRFRLLGEREDVPRLMGAMDAFCLHSRSEAVPMVLLEAMALALPCVVTDVGDAAIMVDDTGIVVPPGDPEALAGGLARVAAMSSEERRQLGLRGQTRVREHYTIERVCERFDDLYRRVRDDVAAR